MPYAKLFRSRWAALLWAAGIIWTAVDVAGVSPSAPAARAKSAGPAKPASTGDPETDRDLAILATVMNGN